MNIYLFRRMVQNLDRGAVVNQMTRMANVDRRLLLVTGQHPYMNIRLQQGGDGFGHLL